MREQETNIKREAADAIISNAGQNISQFDPKWHFSDLNRENSSHV